MISVARSPVTSPALRTVISASSNPSFPFHHVVIPSSPLSAPPSIQMPQISIPGSPRISTESSPHILGSPTLGGYFNTAMASPSLSLSHQLPPSSRFLAPPQIDVRTPPVSDFGSEFHSNPFEVTTANILQELTYTSILKVTQSGSQNATETQTRRRPSFQLDLPRPRLEREDTFRAVALAGLASMPVTPTQLRWNSDLIHSVVTMKPTKERVPTPYPKFEGEWIEDVDSAIREDIQTRLSRLL